MVTRELTKGITRDITRGIIQPFNYFIFTVKTDNAGTSLSDQFTVPTVSGGTYDAYVDWGDGSAIENITTYNDARWTHTFAGGAGTYTIKIWGTFTGLKFNNGGDKLKLLSITQWGCLKLGASSLSSGAFYGCSNLTLSSVTDILDTSNNPEFLETFRDCAAITTIPNLGNWNMSNIFRTQTMFFGCTNFNEPSIVNWNVSKITTMPFMFFGCTNFNQPIGQWVLSGFTTISLQGFLQNCTAFNQDLSSWGQYIKNTSSLTSFMTGVTLSTANYDALLTEWANYNWTNGLTPNFGSSSWKFGFGGQSRFDLISIYSWTITDNGQSDSTMGAWFNAHNVLKSSANPANGTTISSWKDLSDNNLNAEDATNGPRFDTNVANGEPMLYFDGANTRLDIVGDTPTNDLFQGGGSFICAILPLSDGEGDLGRIFSQSGGNMYLDVKDESDGSCRLRLVHSFSGSSGIWETVDLDININEVNIITIEFDSSSSSNNPVFYINSTTPTPITETLTPSGTPAGGVNIQVGNAAVSNKTFDGYMGDLGFFKSIPSSTIREERMNYLATKYGKTLA